MKLHLGCGQVYLDGYRNIDFPLSEHTVQERSVADEHADLTKLRYAKGSIDEIRLHHVFEHFPRHIAVALLAGWQIWLKRGGKLMIEVPDFTESAKLVIDPETPSRDNGVALRHIFGSNEAPWAIHYEGWTEDNFRRLLKSFGFTNIEIAKESYKATRNITVVCKKGLFSLNHLKAHMAAKKYLKDFTVDDTDFESSLLDIWMGEFDDQLSRNS